MSPTIVDASGITPPAPSPCSPRYTISSTMLCANPLSVEPIRNSVTATTIKRLAAVDVGQPPVDRNRHRLGEKIDPEDPAEEAQSAQIGDDGRYGRCDDRRFDRNHEDRQARREEDLGGSRPAARSLQSVMSRVTSTTLSDHRIESCHRHVKSLPVDMPDRVIDAVRGIAANRHVEMFGRRHAVDRQRAVDRRRPSRSTGVIFVLSNVHAGKLLGVEVIGALQRGVAIAIAGDSPCSGSSIGRRSSSESPSRPRSIDAAAAIGTVPVTRSTKMCWIAELAFDFAGRSRVSIAARRRRSERAGSATLDAATHQ